MTWAGTEPFNTNTGQFSSGAFPSSTTTNMTLAFTGGQGVFTCPNNSAYNAQFFLLGGAGDPDDNSYVAVDVISFTAPGGQLFDEADVCLIKNGNNGVFFDVGLPLTSARVGSNISGSRSYGTSGSIGTTANLPLSIAISWAGNIFTLWWLKPGTGWTSFATRDMTSTYDFTAPGARVGWRPGIIPTCQPNQMTLTIDNLRWGPTTDLTSGFNYLPPTALTTVFATNSQIEISWTASSAFVGSGLGPPTYYDVYRNGVLVGTTTGGATSFVDTGGPFSGSYVYTVAAANSSGTPLSGISSPLTVTVAPVELLVPFAAAPAFKPTMLANVKGIVPRIYVPIENNTVRTKQ